MRLLRPENPAVPDEGQNPVPIGAAGVDTFGAVHPALEDFIEGGVEVFDPAADLGREGAGENRRQSQRHTGGGRNHGDSFRCRLLPERFPAERGRKALFPARRVRGLFHGDHINMESDN